jgi:hypothetical protein
MPFWEDFAPFSGCFFEDDVSAVELCSCVRIGGTLEL